MGIWVGKKWLFCFAEILDLSLRAKPNELPKAFWMRLAKIIFKKVWKGTNNKHRGRSACRFSCCPIALWSVYFVHLSKWFVYVLKFKFWFVCFL